MSKNPFIVLNVFLAFLTIVPAYASPIFGCQNPIYGKAKILQVPAHDSSLRFLGSIGLGLALLWTLAAL